MHTHQHRTTPTYSPRQERRLRWCRYYLHQQCRHRYHRPQLGFPTTRMWIVPAIVMRMMMMTMRSTYVSRMCNTRRLWHNCVIVPPAQTTIDSRRIASTNNNGKINSSSNCFGCQIAWPPPSVAFPPISIATSRDLYPQHRLLHCLRRRRTTVAAHKRTANMPPPNVVCVCEVIKTRNKS